MYKYVIIGGSAAAVGAVESVREIDSSGTIAVVSNESLLAYSRPMIGEYLAGEASSDRMMYRTHEFWNLKNVETFSVKALKVNLDGKSIRLDGKEEIGYDKLLIATGSRPVLPKIDGIDKEGVFSFNTMADARALRSQIQKAKNAAIIGGGLVGVCAAEALVKVGLQVTVIELREHILSLLLDNSASEIVEAAIRKKGVTIITGHSVQQIRGRENDENKVGSVIMENGEAIPCDIVVIAIGVSPCIELVRGTKIETNRGIRIDRFMRTSVPDVYACGDVAEIYDFVSNDNRVLPQWPTAYSAGKIAGYNMAGISMQYAGGTAMSAMKYFDVPVVSIGITNPKDSDEHQILTSRNPGANSYKRIVLKDGKIKGLILVGDIEKAGIYFYLMREGVSVDEFKEQLLSEGFGLISLPERLRKKVLSEA